MRPAKTVRTALALAALIALGGCAVALQPKAQGAPARGDHREMAAYYTGEARRLEADALEHENLARSYAGLSLGASDGLWARHCARLAEKLRGAAEESVALAGLHERAAAGEPR